jgi:TRAP-type transport system periplasmic protein
MKGLFQLVALAFGLVFATSVAAQVKWDLATAYPPQNFHTLNIVEFASEVEKATGGKLKITVHPNATLYKGNEIKRAVQTNQIQTGEIIISGFANEDPLFGLDGIPFLADDYVKAKKLWAASRQAVEAKLDRQNMKVLFSVPWPPQGIYSNKPIEKGSDLKGMKWRSYNPASARMAELLQAQPVTIQAAELSQALATGVVESFISSPTTGVETKAYEHLKYFYDVRAWVPKNMVVINKKVFSDLDKSTQEIILKAAADAEIRGWQISEERNAWFLAELQRNGMNVLPPSPQFKSDLDKIGETLIAEWLKQAGPEGQAIINAYRQ